MSWSCVTSLPSTNTSFESNVRAGLAFQGLVFDEPLRCDVLVEDCLLLELKCVQEILPIHKAQLLSYMKLLEVPLGLLINFHELKLADGVVRLILPGANR